jgi:hypothetical protein
MTLARHLADLAKVSAAWKAIIVPCTATGGVLFCPPPVFASRGGRTGDSGILGEKIGEGAIADIHAWAPGQVVKLFKAGFPRRLGWLGSAHDPRRLRRRDPGAGGARRGDPGGRFGVMLSRLDGPTLLQLSRTGAVTSGKQARSSRPSPYPFTRRPRRGTVLSRRDGRLVAVLRRLCSGAHRHPPATPHRRNGKLDNHPRLALLEFYRQWLGGRVLLEGIGETWPRKSSPEVAPAIPEKFPAPLSAIAGPVGDMACVPQAKGEKVTLGAVYAGYRRWCEEKGLSARGATEFAVDFKAIAARYGIRTRKDGTKISCLDVS